MPTNRAVWHHNARFLGLRSLDYARCQLSPSVQIKLNDQDIKRARQIALYPWFASKKPWQKEIELMLKNGFKLEVEALISKDISYVTEEYAPARLKEKEFLDQLVGPGNARHGGPPRFTHAGCRFAEDAKRFGGTDLPPLQFWSDHGYPDTI